VKRFWITGGFYPTLIHSTPNITVSNSSMMLALRSFGAKALHGIKTRKNKMEAQYVTYISKYVVGTCKLQHLNVH